MNPGLSGSHVSAFLPRREIGKQRTHWEAPEQNQRGALMGVSVLMHPDLLPYSFLRAVPMQSLLMNAHTLSSSLACDQLPA